MFEQLELKLDHGFRAEVRDNTLVIDVQTEELSDESRLHLRNFCESLDLTKAMSEIVYSETVDIVKEMSLINTIKSRIK